MLKKHVRKCLHACSYMSDIDYWTIILDYGADYRYHQDEVSLARKPAFWPPFPDNPEPRKPSCRQEQPDCLLKFLRLVSLVQ